MIRLLNAGLTYNAGNLYEKKVLSDINLEIGDNETVGIIGESGCGKTSLIKLINALLLPTQGRVLVDGLDAKADKRALAEIRKKVGVLFQLSEEQVFEESVFREVAFGLSSGAADSADVRKKVSASLEMAGVKDAAILDRNPFTLSSGMLKKIAIASIIAYDPMIYIFDEPTTGLDRAGRDAFWEIIKVLKEKKRTLLIISHNMDDIYLHTERLLVLEKGRLLEDGPTPEVFETLSTRKDFCENVPDALRLRHYVRDNFKISWDGKSVRELAALLSGRVGI